MQSDASTSPRRRSTSCYSDSGDSCSEPFGECGSDDLSFTPAAAAGIHRLLLSCVAEASEDAISSLMAELESPAPSLDSLRRAAMELRLLAKHNPDIRVRIVKAEGVRPLVKLQEHGVTALLRGLSMEHGVVAEFLSLRDCKKVYAWKRLCAGSTISRASKNLFDCICRYMVNMLSCLVAGIVLLLLISMVIPCKILCRSIWPIFMFGV